MKNLFLLVFFIFTLSVSAQTDSTRQAAAKDSLQKITADSLSKIQDTSKTVVPDSLVNKLPVRDSVQPVITPPDTTKGQTKIPLQNDSIGQALTPPDSLKTQIPKDTIRPAKVLFKDSSLYKTIRTSPDSIKHAMLDSLTPEQLLEYYQSEPDMQTVKKGGTVGDSLYYVLNPQTLPTRTVVTDYTLLSEEETNAMLAQTDSSTVEQQLRPKVSLGVGRLSFHGDLYRKKYQSILIGRPAFDLAISQRLSRYLQLDFTALVGKIGANENLAYRHENFQSEIRAGGVNLLYDFGNYIPDRYTVRPFVSFGVYGFEFLSKTDLRDKHGRTYHYWQDGSIKDKAEGSPDAQYAQNLIRDYTYESDVRELNKDGFGKYREAAWAFPVGAGVVMKVNDRIDVKLNYQYFFSTTDYIDGISHKSLGLRQGNKRKDNFSYASVSVQYDLTAKKKTPRQIRMNDTIDYNDAYLMALFNKDSDKDSIIDVNDECLETPEGVKVDGKGCPLDGDADGVPDFRDDELATLPGLGVNLKGVGCDLLK